MTQEYYRYQQQPRVWPQNKMTRFVQFINCFKKQWEKEFVHMHIYSNQNQQVWPNFFYLLDSLQSTAQHNTDKLELCLTEPDEVGIASTS